MVFIWDENKRDYFYPRIIEYDTSRRIKKIFDLISMMG
jgi:hypothetical protein